MSSSQATPPGSGADPSMEDILASIRRILSEDGAQAPAVPAVSVPPAPAPAPRNVLALDSSMLVNEPKAAPPIAAGTPLSALNAIVSPGMETQLPPVHLTPPAPPPEPAPPIQAAAPLPAPAPVPDATMLVAPSAAAAAAASVEELVRTLTAERQAQVYRGGPTIEDVVREEMRPILKAWLDTNLAPMVERLVRLEIERVVGRSVS